MPDWATVLAAAALAWCVFWLGYGMGRAHRPTHPRPDRHGFDFTIQGTHGEGACEVECLTCHTRDLLAIPTDVKPAALVAAATDWWRTHEKSHR